MKQCIRSREKTRDLPCGIRPESAQTLEQRLAAFEQETGHQIAVLTVPSLEGDAIEDFGIRVAEAWKIGKKGKDNGLLFLVAVRDRKIWIATGYGAEKILPDGRVGYGWSEYLDQAREVTCTSCGKCVQACPTGAMAEKGWGVEEMTKHKTAVSRLTSMRGGR